MEYREFSQQDSALDDVGKIAIAALLGLIVGAGVGYVQASFWEGCAYGIASAVIVGTIFLYWERIAGTILFHWRRHSSTILFYWRRHS